MINKSLILKCTNKTGETTIKYGSDVYKITSTAKKVATGANAPIEGTASWNNPTIPNGFYAINTKEAKWKDENGNNVVASNIDNGLVIMNEAGDQFVWVPVKDPVAVDMNNDETINEKDIDLMIAANRNPMAIATDETNY